jgi:5S rRNA maturation endonuclease (ribonuclease M5)
MWGFSGKEQFCDYREIVRIVPEIVIISYYMGRPISYGRKYRSLLRVDNNPSIAFYPGKGDQSAYYFDFSMSKKPQNVVSFVGEFLKIEGYRNICTQINRDLKVGLLDLEPDFKSVKHEGYTGEVDLNQKFDSFATATCVTQSFTKRDRLFWANFGISLATLKKYNVYSTAKVIMPMGDNILYQIGCPIYTYHFGGSSKKIYMPLRRGTRFLNYGETAIQGIDQLPEKGELLIITKSLKDVMLLSELGYYAIAPNSETHGLDLKIVENLKERFTNVILFFDNDEPGEKASEVFSELYKIKSIFLDKKDAKDISDFYYKIKSHKKCKETMEKLIG